MVHEGARADEIKLGCPASLRVLHRISTPHHFFTRASNMTLRFCRPCGERKIPDTLCQACRARYYCSRECQQTDQVRHRSECVPSVPVEGATSIDWKVHLSSTVQQFEQEALLRRGVTKEPPAVLDPW
ncbi:hypothetical protein P168DRAFT_157514 [Aspergillus campestris IBT 28561]|uniref:MYND-type domain-containing protein n=1 Tax=Aspergillus campestris (strain IBT 28561) TaxID=1392248 RepID=A0A2I1D3B1_ASPC2|nr:uncharacterized protein P168DRAFT_157514 [Aspergillus campestris IBT 28561]PKY04371.1 hypothetical protein P168DRAFT_157514 [Aspergillus campestris IBT 28561]